MGTLALSIVACLLSLAAGISIGYVIGRSTARIENEDGGYGDDEFKGM